MLSVLLLKSPESAIKIENETNVDLCMYQNVQMYLPTLVPTLRLTIKAHSQARSCETATRTLELIIQHDRFWYYSSTIIFQSIHAYPIIAHNTCRLGVYSFFEFLYSSSHNYKIKYVHYQSFFTLFYLRRALLARVLYTCMCYYA